MNKERKEILTKVSYLYYVLDKNQDEISQELGIHRSTVSRMVKQAKDENIVTIQIKDLDLGRYQLEEYIKEKYKLKRVIIVPYIKNTSTEEKDFMLARESAFQMKQIIQNNQIIGVSWGSTLAKAIEQIKIKKDSHATFVPIVGGPSHINSKYHVNTLVYELANRFGGKSIFVNSSVIQETKQIHDEILQSKYFNELKSYWRKLDVAIVGIGGNLNTKESQWRDLLTKEDYDDLNMRAAVGDCCCRFCDRDGNVLYGDLYDRTIGVSLEQLQKVPTVVGIARSKQKSRAILAMIKNKYINVLISDEETIIQMLKYDQDEYINTFPK
jgi:DNA-binding transcriptional regulator LsrR (DeoR family)